MKYSVKLAVKSTACNFHFLSCSLHFSLHWVQCRPLFYSSGFQSVDPERAASASFGNLLKMENLRPHYRSAESETLSMGPRNLCMTEFCRWFWCRLKFENCCCKPGVDKLQPCEPYVAHRLPVFVNSFIETQPNPFIYGLSLATFVLQWQRQKSLNCLLSGPLQRTLLTRAV